MNPLYPSTRDSAQQRLAEFAEQAAAYSRERNFVVPDHENVSRLSPAITCGLISEQEVAQHVLARSSFPKVEKFIQEVYWRRYWKGWLEMRPAIWQQYLEDLSKLAPSAEAERLMKGEGDVAVMNQFVRELRDTGYLHNHARMWFAAYWVHTLRLPWQLGADFFYRHLLDADAASNTLSWRWIAGLQTRGKTYLARASNIRKFMHEDLLYGMESGLETLTTESAQEPTDAEFEAAQVETVYVEPSLPRSIGAQAGFWVHEEDLTSDLAFPEASSQRPILLTQSASLWVEDSSVKHQWRASALMSTHERLVATYKEANVSYRTGVELGDALSQWARDHELSQIVTSAPEVGYLADQLPQIIEALEVVGVELICYERAEYAELRPLSKAGFFGFWKKAQKHVI